MMYGPMGRGGDHGRMHGAYLIGDVVGDGAFTPSSSFSSSLKSPSGHGDGGGLVSSLVSYYCHATAMLGFWMRRFGFLPCL